MKRETCVNQDRLLSCRLLSVSQAIDDGLGRDGVESGRRVDDNVVFTCNSSHNLSVIEAGEDNTVDTLGLEQVSMLLLANKSRDGKRLDLGIG